MVSPAPGVLTLEFADLAVISAFRDLGEQVPLCFMCLPGDPVVPQGSELLLLLSFGQQRQSSGLLTLHCVGALLPDTP